MGVLTDDYKCICEVSVYSMLLNAICCPVDEP